MEIICLALADLFISAKPVLLARACALFLGRLEKWKI